MTFVKKWDIKNRRLFNCWHAMIGRCRRSGSKDSKYYHDKGITVCEEWKDYHKFQDWALLNGYENSLTLDRIDGTKNYEPSNCRWITIDEQQRNKSNCIYLEYKGKIRTLSEIARMTGINRTTLHDRIFRFGYSLEDAVKKNKMHPRNTVLINYNGETYSQTQLAKMFGVTIQAISKWRKLGMNADEMKKRAIECNAKKRSLLDDEHKKKEIGKNDHMDSKKSQSTHI